MLWSLGLIPIAPFWADTSTSTDSELPVYAFSIFSLLCLFTSSVWHTMAGCAHSGGMELCAKVDYVGIGWSVFTKFVFISFGSALSLFRLISASIGTVVYYGFQCNPTTCQIFLGLCLLMGLSGSVLPFTHWFNQYEYRVRTLIYSFEVHFSNDHLMPEIPNIVFRRTRPLRCCPTSNISQLPLCPRYVHIYPYVSTVSPLTLADV